MWEPLRLLLLQLPHQPCRHDNDDGGALACDSSQQQQGDDVYGDGDELQHDDDRDDDAVQKLYLCKWMPLLWGRKYTFS